MPRPASTSIPASTMPSPAWGGIPGTPARRPSPMAGRRSCWPRCSAERPSFGSSVFPWGTGPEDGVEDAEEAAHAGDDGNLFGAAAGDELLVVGLEHRVPADGG